MTFEQSLARLEQIAGALDRDDLPLEDALKLFEEGITRLHDAEHLALRSDHADFGHADAVIDAGTSKHSLTRIEVGLVDGRNLQQEGSTLQSTRVAPLRQRGTAS